VNSASNSQVDEIENLEKYRDTGIKPSGPLSEEMKDQYNKIAPFRLEKEPIFDSILLNMVLGNSVNLKKKARIKIRDSAVLIGIIDDQGLLNEGEIFVRIQRQSFAIDEMTEEFCQDQGEKKAEYE
jgi:hypothetical protein